MNRTDAAFWPGRALRAALAASLAGLLGLAAQPSQPARALDAVNIYLPDIQRNPLPVGPLAIANPSFEEEDWSTVWPPGNQLPSGWTTWWAAAGEVMPFLRYEGADQAPVYADGPGEYVHKYEYQLPDEEHLGEARALILDGQLVYKAFSNGVQHVIRLSQTLTGTPGEYAKVVAFILNEEDKEGEVGCCAHDNSVVSVKLGDVEDLRLYGDMKNRFDISGNERAWNRFEVIAQFPASGELLLEITMQQSWQTRTDFFIDNLSGEILRDP